MLTGKPSGQHERLSHSLQLHRQPLPFVGAAPESGKTQFGHGEGEALWRTGQHRQMSRCSSAYS